MGEDTREISKARWNASDPKSFDAINSGSLQRIADAVELMAKNHAHLIADRDRFERNWNCEKDRHAAAERRIIALRGVVTRLKGKK